MPTDKANPSQIAIAVPQNTPQDTDAMEIKNLFASNSPPMEGEKFETLLAHKNLVVERILSSSRITSTEFVQPQDEWVVLLQGNATLDIAGQSIELKSGDYLFLPSHTPHTVLSVSQGALWLAVHLYDPKSCV